MILNFSLETAILYLNVFPCLFEAKLYYAAPASASFLRAGITGMHQYSWFTCLLF